MMTPRQRVESILRGEMPDQVPFTVYSSMLPRCEAERRLRNEGVCPLESTAVVKVHRPNVRSRTCTGDHDGGATGIRETHDTPVGSVTALKVSREDTAFTQWAVERLFKGPQDYKVLKFIVQDEQYEEDYARIARRQEMFGGDVMFRAKIDSTPLHQIMVHWMGIERFAVEWHDNRDEVLDLYDAMVAQRRKLYPLVARSPVLFAQYGGNEVPQVMGLERFEKYVVPLYNEAGAIMHEHGKLIGAHLDGDNRLWADAVAASALDYIDAFTPSPDSDMTLADALAAWPSKIIWTNFPSSVHLRSIDEIKRTTRLLLREATPGDRFILTITEDMPPDRWQGNLLAISQVLREEGALPLKG